MSASSLDTSYANVSAEIVGSMVAFMCQLVRQAALERPPAEVSANEKEDAATLAVERALARLVDCVNRALPEGAAPFTAESLRHPVGEFSIEFSVYLDSFCGAISDDPRFQYHRPRAMARTIFSGLAQAFPLRHVYALLP